MAQAPPDYSGQPQGQFDPSQGQSGGPDGQAPPDEAGPAVARLSVVNGGVSVRRGDTPDPVAATPNAPVLAGDTIAVGQGGRAEVEFDFANRLRLGSEAEARIAEMQAGLYRIELARGTATFSVVRDSRAQVEVSTPNVSIRPLARGLYRVWVRDDGQTIVTVRSGEAEVYTERGSERVRQGQTMFIRGTAQDPEYQISAAVATDEWDSWNDERDRMVDRARSYQYVNPDVTGAEDLDAYGSWTNDSTYGQVWAPRVAAGWSPYGDGRWAWEDYYGWTWVSNDPWGWAPYHYGNWFYGSAGWCWWPGSIYTPTFWRPALVGFFGFGGGFGFGNWGNVGWVPLAPYERFVPWYGRGGWRSGYGNNMHLMNANIANGFRNARIGNGLHGVSASAFTNGQFSNIARLRTDQIRNAGLVRGALPVTPTANNLRFSNQQAAVTPHSFNANSHFYSRTPLAPSQRMSFQQQQQFAQRSSQPQTQYASPGNGSSNWSRFGSPNRVGTGSVAPARTSSGWGSFGSSAPVPNNSYRNGQGNAQSLRIAPPIVHERAYDPPARTYSQPSYNQPSYNRPSYNSPSYRAPSYNAPSYNAPRYSAPSYNAPRYSPQPAHSSGGNGGGGHYSAPASHPSGGGGGHSSGGGGGHSSGGGSAHHGR